MNNLKHLKLDRVQGPLIVLSNVSGVGYDEIGSYTGRKRLA